MEKLKLNCSGWPGRTTVCHMLEPGVDGTSLTAANPLPMSCTGVAYEVYGGEYRRSLMIRDTSVLES